MGIRVNFSVYPEVREGLNFSVHLGNKWWTERFIGQIITISPLGIDVTIEALHACKFKNMPQFVLTFYHSSKARTIEGLIKEQTQAYPMLVGMSREQLAELPFVAMGFIIPEGFEGATRIP